MKYYSETLDKLFDSEAELKKAENTALEEKKRKQALKDERAKRAKEVDEAIEHASDLLNKFIEDYGTFHSSIGNDKSFFATLLSLFD